MVTGVPSVKDSKNKLSIMEGILPANLMLFILSSIISFSDNTFSHPKVL